MPDVQKTTARRPLPLPDDEWRSRWLVDGRWNALHRVAEIEWEDGEKISGRGISVCGRERRWQMPGILSRLDLKRCPECCAALGIPRGDGAPFNAFEGDARNA